MVYPQEAGDIPSDIVVGNRCMLSIMGRQFLVEIIAGEEGSIRTAFPLANFLLEGGLPVAGCRL